jgi:hypothetical protein
MRLPHLAFADIISQIASLPHEAAFAPHRVDSLKPSFKKIHQQRR